MTTQAPIARFTRLRHASFASPDPERLLDYYRAVIGLGLVGRDGSRIFLANDFRAAFAGDRTRRRGADEHRLRDIA